jgi:hypothetical protein
MQVCAGICVKSEDMAPEKEKALAVFLSTYELASGLMSLVVSARTAGHPAFQGDYKDIAAVSMTEIQMAQVTLTRERDAWLKRKEVCCAAQPRLCLLTASQQLDLAEAVQPARDGDLSAFSRCAS